MIRTFPRSSAYLCFLKFPLTSTFSNIPNSWQRWAVVIFYNHNFLPEGRWSNDYLQIRNLPIHHTEYWKHSWCIGKTFHHFITPTSDCYDYITTAQPLSRAHKVHKTKNFIKCASAHPLSQIRIKNYHYTHLVFNHFLPRSAPPCGADRADVR